MKSKNQPSSSDALSVFAFLCCCCTRAFVWHIVILATPVPAAAAAALTVSSSSPSPSSSLLGQENRAVSTQTASTRKTTISNATKTCLATDGATPTLTDHDDDSKHAENKHHHSSSSSSSSPSGSNATAAPPQHQSDCQPMQTVESGPNQESLLDSFSEPPGTTAPACGVYLAASTIPGAGLGLFAGQDYDIGQTVGQEEVCWPVIDIQWHQASNTINPLSNYVWFGSVLGMLQETNRSALDGGSTIDALCFGFGALPNSDPALWNVGMFQPVYRDASLHRSRDAGVGAFSPYHMSASPVRKWAPAGTELFKHYGNGWFEHRAHWFPPVYPLQDDWIYAQYLLTKLGYWADRVTNHTHSSTEGGSNYIIHQEDKPGLETGSEDSSLFADAYNLILTLKYNYWYSRTLHTFPDNVDLARMTLQHYQGDLGAAMRQPSAIRPISWLQQYGRCQDHIRPGRSTIYSAGHGAFAARSLSAGTILSTSPLHHMPDRSFLTMSLLQQDPKTNQWLRNNGTVVGYQLGLNYCFSHPESTVLLCPYGAGVNFINHAPSDATITAHAASHPLANVRIQWASDFTAGHNHTMVQEGTLDDLAQIAKPILSFDYVVTRDIVEGEELFLDYGVDWVRAWDKHEHQYVPPANAPTYQSARYWNQQQQLWNSSSVLRTESEQQYDPYPRHLELRCHEELINANDNARLREWVWVWEPQHMGVPCRILNRTVVGTDQYEYTVQLTVPNYQQANHPTDSSSSATSILTIPRSALSFLDQPLSTDLRLPQTFRHWIGIPDFLFPEQWKNQKRGRTLHENAAKAATEVPLSNFKIKIQRKGG